MKTSIQYFQGYWTLFAGSQAIISVSNLWDAIEAQAEIEGEFYA